MSPRLAVVTQRTSESGEMARPDAPQVPTQEPDPLDPGPEKVGPRPPWSSKRWLIAVLVLAVGAASAYGHVHRKHLAAFVTVATVPPVIELAQSEVFTVKLAEVRHTVHLSGSLRPVRQSVVKSEVGARVREVLVQEGQPVSKGDVLARIDVSDLTSRFNEKLMLLEEAKAQLTLAEKTRAAKLALKQDGYATQSTVNEVESNYRVQAANVRAIETQIEVARKALGDAIVLAPISGVIGERSVNPGEKVAIDGKLFTIIDLSDMEVEAMISTNDIDRVAVGQTVEFVVPGLDQKQFVARVVRINPTTKSGTRSVPVYVQVNNEAQSLRGGMFAIGEIIVDRSESLVAIPTTAVRTDVDGRYALVLADGAVRKQPITVKGEPGDAELVAVAQGLATGDIVISAPSIALDPGTRIHIGSR
jgi:membrane fusion protein, multidrug efflux system